MERVRISGLDSPAPIYLSGDHNPQGIQSLLELLGEFPRRRLKLVVGVGKDKDLDGILGPLLGLPDADLYLTETPFRGRPLTDYGHWLALAKGSDADPLQALKQAASQAQSGDLILVTGSLYLVGAIRAHLAN
jgi:dihydrofolate synthase/folylpolyglutamate synthase